ncbi:ATP-binding protein [Patescibacteria group bacterium]|nr:ATP-binding protein [Patescibacteria group bacterium]
MFIKRAITEEIKKSLNSGKAIIIYGPRQVGKTTLIQKIKDEIPGNKLFVSGEDRFVREWLSSQSIEILKRNLAGYDTLFIDEAQYIDKIGLNIKLIVDHIKSVKVVATGSSSFELSNQVGEPLVGRKWQYELFPISQLELKQYEDYSTSTQNLPERLIFGSYPEVVTSDGLIEKKNILNSIVDNYLYKDILAMGNLKRPEKLIDLLKLLAFQIGKEVSVSELASSLNINFATVERYLDLLTKVFVIVRVNGFSRNLRKEVTKNSRYYFYDNGIRNAIINNFNDLKTRDDVGVLWENYVFIERLKKRKYSGIIANQFFWRTYDQKEIDLLEEREGKIFGFEFKWKKGEKVKAPKSFLEAYPGSEFKVINQENYLDFLT